MAVICIQDEALKSREITLCQFLVGNFNSPRNLSAFIDSPESSGGHWLLIAPWFSVVICRGGWSVRRSQLRSGDGISPLEVCVLNCGTTSRAEMQSRMFMLVNAC